MSIVSKRRNIFTSASASSGGSGVQSVNSGTDITVDNTDPANPIINFTGTYQDPITVVANYSALPTASTVTGEFYWCSASQGTAWLPGSLGGTYYSAGLYYSNGSSWEFMSVPYQATQTEVNTGTNSDKFVTPNTLFNSSKWSNFVPYTGATSDVDLGARILSAQSLQVTGTNGAGHIHLRHQASDATATGQTTALFANSNGDLKYKNAGNYYTTFATSANTANRVYTFPNADGTVALTSNLSSYVPTSRTLTINGTAFDLSADRSWTVSSGITVGTTTITSGTSGRIAFNNGGVYGESANLFLANSNTQLCVGQVSPSTWQTYANHPLVVRNSLGNNFVVGYQSGQATPYLAFFNDAATAAQAFDIYFRNSIRIINDALGNPIFSLSPTTGAIINFGTSIKTNATATAQLHIGAGTATANTAPLKLTSGTNLTTPETGAVEYDGTNLFFTPSSTRNILAQISGSTGLTTSQIPFATTNGYLTSTSNFNWDNTNNRLNIGTSSPAYSWNSMWIQGNYWNGSLSRNAVVINTANQTSMSEILLTTNSINSTNTSLRQYGTSSDSPFPIYGINPQGYGHLFSDNTKGFLISTNTNNTFIGIGAGVQNTASNLFFWGGASGVSIKNGTTTATAYLHLGAGTATANTAPIKLTAGTNLTTPENGAFEFDGTTLYFTVGGVRKTVNLL